MIWLLAGANGLRILVVGRSKFKLCFLKGMYLKNRQKDNFFVSCIIYTSSAYTAIFQLLWKHIKMSFHMYMYT